MFQSLGKSVVTQGKDMKTRNSLASVNSQLNRLILNFKRASTLHRLVLLGEFGLKLSCMVGDQPSRGMLATIAARAQLSPDLVAQSMRMSQQLSPIEIETLARRAAALGIQCPGLLRFFDPRVSKALSRKMFNVVVGQAGWRATVHRVWEEALTNTHKSGNLLAEDLARLTNRTHRSLVCDQPESVSALITRLTKLMPDQNRRSIVSAILAGACHRLAQSEDDKLDSLTKLKQSL